MRVVESISIAVFCAILLGACAGGKSPSSTSDSSTAGSESSRDGSASDESVSGTSAASTGNAADAMRKIPEKERNLDEAETARKEQLIAKVLDPARFRTAKWQDRPTVPAAYAIAKKHPDILERLFCYCGCDLTERHVTLLDCFTDSDEHGASCSECIDEAFLADQLFRDGATMARIQQIVDEQFCPKYPFAPSERTKTYKTYLTAKRLYTSSTEPICGAKFSGE
ncbi:MAG: PCYCGC domain-containing protein [Candidatus Obscuribacterales bacterium]|nr:PCYCGC domain-containing protein [Candidatus Obscuribacterales bacterium]